MTRKTAATGVMPGRPYLTKFGDDIAPALSRRDALKTGAKFYWGKPCRHGHEGLRNLDGGCVHCRYEKTSSVCRSRDALKPSRMVEIDHKREEQVPDYYDGMVD